MADENEKRALAFQKIFNGVLNNIELVIKGKSDQVATALVALFAEGHLLLQDKPGTGKTTLAKAIARSIGGEMRRIQFTPDLLPADVTGGEIYNQRDQCFEPHRGPVFANVVLADEINRASPKTQAAMLEVMEERQVTMGSDTLEVPRPFVVIATQNPIEQEGTYRLPEAQLDRFLMRLSLDYPDRDSTIAVLRGSQEQFGPDDLAPKSSMGQLEEMIDWVRGLHVADSLVAYIVELVEATRPEAGRLDGVELGVSTRGAVGLMRAAQVHAAAAGRAWVDVQDVKQLAPSVLAHRMILSTEAEAKGVKAEDLITALLPEIDLPPDLRAS